MGSDVKMEAEMWPKVREYWKSAETERGKRKRQVTESYPETLQEAMQEHKRCWFNTWVGKIPWWRAWQLTPVFSPGKSHGQRSLEGYSL